MNRELFNEKLRLLQADGGHDPALVQDLGSWLLAAGELELHRINPVALAAKRGLDETAVIDFFVHGGRLGLFDFSWSMICPSCGEIQNNDQSLDALEGEFYCVVCQAPVKVNIDDTVEVSFSLNPAIHQLKLDPFANADNYRAVFFSDAVERSPEMLAYMERIWQGFESVEPGETLIIDRAWERGQSYRLVSAGVHAQFLFHVAADAAEDASDHEIVFGEKGMQPQEITVHSTNAHLRVSNQLSVTVGLMMVKADFKTLHGFMRQAPSRLKPMLTGNRLLSNQRFRELYKIQNLSPTLRLNIRSVTLLFTDLKGSTELYDQSGDINAYSLIQEHFQLVGKIIAKNSGALIKTMGDAVMASFARPLDAVRAATQMLDAHHRASGAGPALGLKIGLHEGPALAINNQGSLDYFGQTVNIAARVQGLASAGTLWMTDPVLQAQGVGQTLRDQGFGGKRYQASLKGVGAKTTVYELKRAAG